MKENSLKYIYWFANYGLDSPSVRYRAKFPLDYLKSHHGLKSSLVIPGYSPKKIYRFVQAYFSAMFFPKTDSVIVIQKVRSNFIYSNLLKLLVLVSKVRTIYDVDDAIYLEHPGKTVFFFCRKCSAICVGSEGLADELKSLNQNILINTTPTPHLNIVKESRNEVFRIGWIGFFGGGHKEALVKKPFPCSAKSEV